MEETLMTTEEVTTVEENQTPTYEDLVTDVAIMAQQERQDVDGQLRKADNGGLIIACVMGVLAAAGAAGGFIYNRIKKSKKPEAEIVEEIPEDDPRKAEWDALIAQNEALQKANDDLTTIVADRNAEIEKLKKNQRK